ncbi:MAG: hypothetical protein ACI8PP_001255 [Candidatus Pseudothioglobus sp.]|jgi:hypothetical protein
MRMALVAPSEDQLGELKAFVINLCSVNINDFVDAVETGLWLIESASDAGNSPAE